MYNQKNSRSERSVKRVKKSRKKESLAMRESNLRERGKMFLPRAIPTNAK